MSSSSSYDQEQMFSISQRDSKVMKAGLAKVGGQQSFQPDLSRVDWKILILQQDTKFHETFRHLCQPCQ